MTTTTEISAPVLLTEAEAAKKILAKAQTLRAWRHRRMGPPYLKLTGQIRYRLDDLEKFIEQSRVVPGEGRGKPRAQRPGVRRSRSTSRGSR
jgi:hypothetical protein